MDASLPQLSEYWVPKPSDMDGEGYGLNFRDVGVLSGVRTIDAHEVMLWERAVAEWVDERASNENEFEVLAKMAESYDPDEPDADFEGLEIPPGLQDGYSLWGLELGVAGLSYMMAATGFYPVASCRSHVQHSWSAEPVVLFAANEARVKLLQPLVKESGCGLDVDATRGQTLLVVYAPSIVEVMNLTSHLYERRGELRNLPKTDRKRSKTPQIKPPPPPTLF